MHSYDEVIIFSSFDNSNINDITYCVSLFTISISNSIVKCLVFGDTDSPFLNAVSKTAIISSVH